VESVIQVYKSHQLQQSTIHSAII